MIDRCRKYDKVGVKIEHVIAGYSSCRYKPELMLESGNMILYWDKSIVTDKTIDFNRPDIVPKDRENKTTLVIDTNWYN